MTQLEWPREFPRTDAAARERCRKFDVTIAKAFNDLEKQLDRLGVDEFRYSFDAESRQTDGRPYKRANPDDPGFVLRWTMDGEQYAVACDRWSKLRDNVRTVGLYIKEKRLMEQRPVETGESEFANARLPPGDEDATPATATTEPAHEVLDVDVDAPPEIVKAAFRAKAKTAHPDQGGTREEWQQLQAAREVMLGE